MEKEKKMKIPYTEKEIKVEVPYIEKKIQIEVPPIQPQIPPEMPPIQPQIPPEAPPIKPQIPPEMPPIQPQIPPEMPPIKKEIKAKVAVKMPSIKKQKKMHYDQYIYYQMIPVCDQKMYEYCMMMAQYHYQMYLHNCKGIPKPQMPMMEYYPMMYENPMYKMNYDMDMDGCD